MKILIVTYSYTPDLTPRAFRWSALASEMARQGHEVHVLCAARVAAGAETAPPDDGVVVHRTPDRLLNASSRVTPASTNAPGGPAPRRTGAGLKALVRPLVRALWRATHWPDFACGWVLPATRAARQLCARHRFDWVISVSHPFTGHVVGLRTDPQAWGAKWLVDIGDPFHLMSEPSPNNRRLYAGLNRRVEARILARADAVCVTTEATQRLYEQHFAVPPTKLRLAPPLLSLPTRPAGTAAGSRPFLRFVFVGTLYRQLRNPAHLLACFEALMAALPERRLELHFYGAVNDCADVLAACPPHVAQALFVHGMVARARVQEAMQDADMLVNIGNDSASQLASKVVEYMAMGRPILNLISIPDDTSAQALSDYPATLTLHRSGAGVPSADDVARMRAFVLHPPAVPQAHVEQIRARFSVAHVAHLYLTQMTAQSAPA